MSRKEASHFENVVTMQIQLRGTEPPVWRRLQVPTSMMLGKLHLVIQDAFGWTNSHLHSFIIDGTEYGEHIEGGSDEAPTSDEKGVRLNDVLKYNTLGFWYRYDFGDDWIHEVQLVDDFTARPPGTVFPRCIGGARSAPPEDCGGWHGYARLLEILSNPKHEEHKDMRRWVGRGFDPEKFDIDAVNKSLKKYARTELSVVPRQEKAVASAGDATAGSASDDSVAAATGVGKPVLLGTLMDAGYEALDAQKFQEAVQKFEECAALAAKLKLPIPVVTSLILAGDAARMGGDRDGAMNAIARAGVVAMDELGIGVHYAYVQAAIARWLASDDRLEDAQDKLESACNILKQHKDEAEPEFVTIYLAHTAGLIEAEQFKEADKWARQTKELAEQVMGELDASTIMAMTMCSVTAEMLDQPKRVAILHRQINERIDQASVAGGSDTLDTADTMMAELPNRRIVDNRQIVLTFDDEEEGGDEMEIVFARPQPQWNNSGTAAKTKATSAKKKGPKK